MYIFLITSRTMNYIQISMNISQTGTRAHMVFVCLNNITYFCLQLLRLGTQNLIYCSYTCEIYVFAL